MASITWTCLGCFCLLIISSQCLISSANQNDQNQQVKQQSFDNKAPDENVSKPPWGPWAKGPQPVPLPNKPYPDRKGGVGGGVRGGGAGGGGRGRGNGNIGGIGECTCNCNCNCQETQCNNHGGGGGGGWGGGSGGGGGWGGGGGGGGGGATICLPMPPLSCDANSCHFGHYGKNFGMGNNHYYNMPHFGERGGGSPKEHTNEFTEGMNSTDEKHH